FGAGSLSHFVAVMDFNHDTRPDLAVANFFGNNISVLLNSSNGSFAGQTFAIDQTAPFVQSINRTTPPGPNTGSSSVTFTATFSEAVTGVDASDFAVVTTGTVTANSTVV